VRSQSQMHLADSRQDILVSSHSILDLVRGYVEGVLLRGGLDHALNTKAGRSSI
jgi:hypothetical protein